LVQKAVGSPISWVGRASQYIGGIYFFAATIVLLRQARTTHTTIGNALASFFRESELHYRSLVETAQDPIISTDGGGRIILWNPAAEAVFGFRPDEAVGSRLVDLIGLKDTVTSIAADAGLARVAEATLARKDGSTLFAEISVARAGDGTVTTLIVRGITERMGADEELRDRGERLRFALEASHMGAWDLDLVNHTAFRSLQHDMIFGYSELLPQWTYEMFLEHVLPEDRAEVDALFRRAAQNQDDWGFECRIRRNDGQIRWIWAAGRHRTDSAGGAQRIAGIVQDITDRKRAEEERRVSREQLEKRVEERTAELNRQASLLNLTTTPFWYGTWKVGSGSGTEGRRKCTDGPAMRPMERCPTNCSRQNFPGDLQSIEAEIRTKGRWGGELVHSTRTGSRIIVISRWALYRENGAPTGVLEINSNVTEQKSVEQQLRQAQKLEALGTLTGGIAHDFNNILAAIVGFAELAESWTEGNEKAQRAVKRILQGGLRGRELVKRMLAFSRSTEHQRVPILLGNVVKETNHWYEPQGKPWTLFRGKPRGMDPERFNCFGPQSR
jgi:PAS domain S-box-containing protein